MRGFFARALICASASTGCRSYGAAERGNGANAFRARVPSFWRLTGTRASRPVHSGPQAPAHHRVVPSGGQYASPQKGHVSCLRQSIPHPSIITMLLLIIARRPIITTPQRMNMTGETTKRDGGTQWPRTSTVNAPTSIRLTPTSIPANSHPATASLLGAVAGSFLPAAISP
jgi:hypothetical protein